MTNTPWECKAPKMIGIELKGKMSGWTTPKDLILHIAGKLTVKGGTGHILEYYGPGLAHQSCTGLATIANMGAEVGATTSTFPYNDSMRAYLHATGRGPVAQEADKAAAKGFFQKDDGAEYDQHISVDLSELEPHLLVDCLLMYTGSKANQCFQTEMAHIHQILLHPSANSVRW